MVIWKNDYHGKTKFENYHGSNLPVTTKKKTTMVGVTTVGQKWKPTMVGVTMVGPKSKKLPVNTPSGGS